MEAKSILPGVLQDTHRICNTVLWSLEVKGYGKLKHKPTHVQTWLTETLSASQDQSVNILRYLVGTKNAFVTFLHCIIRKGIEFQKIVTEIIM